MKPETTAGVPVPDDSIERESAQTLTTRGTLKLARWLVYCEDIGWPEESLLELEIIWRKYRDANGDLR